MQEEIEITEEAIRQAENVTGPWREILHGRLAVEAARNAHIFSETATRWKVTDNMGNATGDDLVKLAAWQQQMKEDVPKINHQQEDDDRQTTGTNVDHAPTVEPMNAGEQVQTDSNCEETDDMGPEATLPPVDVSLLNEDQFHAYDIITQHLRDFLQGKAPP